jgi:hypothetical protein
MAYYAENFMIVVSTRVAVRTVERFRDVHYQEGLLALREDLLSNSARWAHRASPSLFLTTFGCVASRLAGFTADKRASSSPAILPRRTGSKPVSLFILGELTHRYRRRSNNAVGCCRR